MSSIFEILTMIFFVSYRDIEIKKNNQNVEIKFSIHDAFQEEPLTGNAQNRQDGKPNNLKV